MPLIGYIEHLGAMGVVSGLADGPEVQYRQGKRRADDDSAEKQCMKMQHI